MAVPKWKAALEKRKAAKDAMDIKAFSLPDGKTTLRILPNPKDADALFYHDFGQHWVKSKTEKNAAGKPAIIGVALCVSKAYDEPCPYCDAVSEAMGYADDNAHSFSDDEVNLLKEAKSRHRVLLNAAVRAKNGDYEVKLIDLPTTAFNSLIDLIDEWGEDVIATEGGQDVVFTRSGAGINTKYQCVPAKAKGDDIASGWESSCIDLESYVKAQVPSKERALKAFEGIGSLVDLKQAAPSLGLAAPSSESLPTPANTGAYAKSDDGVLDADIDQLESELDDIPDEPAPAAEPEIEVVEPEPETSSVDADLMSELDDLDLDDI